MRKLSEVNPTALGKSYRRRIGTTEWTFVDQAPVEQNKSLYLIREVQGLGQPLHWSLFVAFEGSAGSVYQVKGDAESMHYTHAENMNMMGSDSFKDSFELVSPLTDSAAQWVDRFANAELPPRAESRATVKENCQG